MKRRIQDDRMCTPNKSCRIAPTRHVHFHRNTKSHDGLWPSTHAFYVLLQEIIETNTLSQSSVLRCISKGVGPSVEKQIQHILYQFTRQDPPKRSVVAFPQGGCDFKFSSQHVPSFNLMLTYLRQYLQTATTDSSLKLLSSNDTLNRETKC